MHFYVHTYINVVGIVESLNYYLEQDFFVFLMYICTLENAVGLIHIRTQFFEGCYT